MGFVWTKVYSMLLTARVFWLPIRGPVAEIRISMAVGGLALYKKYYQYIMKIHCI